MSMPVSETPAGGVIEDCIARVYGILKNIAIALQGYGQYQEVQRARHLEFARVSTFSNACEQAARIGAQAALGIGAG